MIPKFWREYERRKGRGDDPMAVKKKPAFEFAEYISFKPSAKQRTAVTKFLEDDSKLPQALDTLHTLHSLVILSKWDDKGENYYTQAYDPSVNYKDRTILTVRHSDFHKSFWTTVYAIVSIYEGLPASREGKATEYDW